MSDIIANAKQLLDGATPGPWHVDNSDPDWAQLVGPVRLDRNLITQDVLADVFDGISDTDLDLAVSAPELAKALAEEKYQYGVTYTGLKHGGQHFQWVESTGDTEWDKETLQLLVKRWKKRGQSPKIVRRRVSQPEVISE